MAERVEHADTYEARPHAAFPVADMSGEVIAGFDYLLGQIIERNSLERDSFGGFSGYTGLDEIVEKKFEAVAPQCNAENCCRSIVLDRVGGGNAAETVLRIACSPISEVDQEEAIRREGRCNRTIQRVGRDFPKFVTEQAEKVRQSQARLQNLTTEVAGENTHLDSLLK
ncbi:MAG TPA: hypothetical protein VK712_00995 [Verrucomicrobiae bacterium]|jgi:hypothetical protein|nr:hypothetical protein [Verrucomicrobiae bacterium]